jgi:hypothetical protein
MPTAATLSLAFGEVWPSPEIALAGIIVNPATAVAEVVIKLLRLRF